MPQNGKSNLGKRVFKVHMPPPSSEHLHLEMSTDSALLVTASKVEAAVEAYIRVWDFTNKAEWRAQFRREFVSAHMCGILHGVLIDLHLK